MSPSKLDPEIVARALLGPLRNHLPGLKGYAEPVEPMKGGLEARVWGFRIEAPDADDLWQGPLIARIPKEPKDVAASERAAAVQGFLADRRFPVPRALLADETELGPVLVMERVGASPVFDDPQHVRHPGRAMQMITDLHVRLHELDTAGWPLPAEGPLVDRRLHNLRELAEASGWGPGGRALEWLYARRGAVADERRSVIHGDFIGNVLQSPDGDLVVVDWADAEVGDRHDDAARAMNIWWVLALLAPVRAVRWPAGLILWRVARAYRRGYEQSFPLDRQRLVYWSALHSLEWSLMFAAMRQRLLGEGRDPARRFVARGLLGISDRLLGRFDNLTGADTGFRAR